MQHPFPKLGIIKASMERLSKVRPGGTCTNLPVRGNWCSFKSGKMVQNVREFLEKSGNLKVRHGWPPCRSSKTTFRNSLFAQQKAVASQNLNKKDSLRFVLNEAAW